MNKELKLLTEYLDPKLTFVFNKIFEIKKRISENAIVYEEIEALLTLAETDVKVMMALVSYANECSDIEP